MDIATVIDLGHQPPSNAYLTAEQLLGPEITYPLKVYVCSSCWLVQLPAHAAAEELFTADYAYFSSTSTSWCAHAERFVTAASERLGLGTESLVVELASNDGYLLQYVQQPGIPCLGIEPTHATAEAARAKGISTIERFFGVALATELEPADLVVANNVLAHVPDINDFVLGFKHALKPTGTITVEFPHLLQLMMHNQFDTIYHEHFSYLSLSFVRTLFASHGLRVYDVEELTTHGGSLRVFGCHDGDKSKPTAPGVDSLLVRERDRGLLDVATYRNFSEQVVRTKCDVMQFFMEAYRSGKRVAGYGAPAKGNTLLNYCGIGPEFLPFTVDRSPHKQGMFLPGTHIPIRSPQDLLDAKPDYVFILPWNLRSEIVDQMSAVRGWGGKFVVPIPALEIF